MKSFNFVSQLSDPKSRTWLVSIFLTASLVSALYFLGGSFIPNNYRMPQRSEMELMGTRHDTESDKCKTRCRPAGSEALPEGILCKTADLDMRPMWGSLEKKNNKNRSTSLLAIAVGIKQKDLINQIVTKFLDAGFVVMLFHYDGVVDQWYDLGWGNRVIHVSARNQTKWWFAKRFLHPDIVEEYEYIFLWDEDLGVENFNPRRYLSIIKEEGLEISQPGLDPATSEIHHQITMRKKNSKVHRRYIKRKGGGRCYYNSTGPPCTGWVEMMVPVFSKAAWRCAWYMIQKDLIHAWGVDFLLGYCAQGDRQKNVGVVDAEYVVHLGVPTLGGSDLRDGSQSNHSQRKIATTDDDNFEPSQFSIDYHQGDSRSEVRKQSYVEMVLFTHRWNDAIDEDKCWSDPYPDKQKLKKCLLRPCQLNKTIP